MSYENLSLLISLLAVIVSLVSLVRSRRLGEEQIKLSKEQLKLEAITAELARYQIKEIEEKALLKDKPIIGAALVRMAGSGEFVIVNSGQGNAYDLNFELIGPGSNVLYDAEEKLPCLELRSNSKLKLKASFHIGSPSVYQAKISWRDSEGLQEDTLWLS